MAFIPAANTARVTMRYTQASQILANTFYVEFVGPPDTGTLNILGAKVRDWWVNNIKPLQYVGVSLVAIECVDMTSEGSAGVEFTTDLPQSGDVTGTSLPNNVTLSIKLATGLTGRSHRGRQYFIGLTVASLADANHVNGTMITNLSNAYFQLIADMFDIGGTLVIASFVENGAPRTTAELTPVLNPSINSTLDSQRRRLPERGL